MFKTQFSSAWMRLLCLVAFALCFSGFAQAQNQQTTLSVFPNNRGVEGGFQEFRLVLSNPATQRLTVFFFTSPGNDNATGARELPGGPFDSDYDGFATDVTFEQNRADLIVRVPIKRDNTYEFDETFFGNITAPRYNGQPANNVTIQQRSAVGIIVNDDNPPNVTILAPPSGILEGDRNNLTRQNLNFTINLEAIAERPLQLSISTVDGSAKAIPPGATNSIPADDVDGDPTDFVGVNNEQVTIAAGTRQQNFFVVILGDDAYEGDQAFTLNLVSTNLGPNGNVVTTSSSVIGVIIDNDLPIYQIDDSQAAVVEGREAVFRFTLIGRNGEPISGAKAPITFNYVFQDVSATFGSDYRDLGPDPFAPPKVGTFTIPIGGVSFTLRTQTIDDNAEEQIESYRLVVNSATNTLPPSGNGNVGVGTIFDNDSAPIVTIASARVVEGTNVPNRITFTVSLTSVTSQIVTVDYQTVNPGTPVPVGTATPGQDYVVIPARTLSFNPGEPTATFTVDIVADTINEPDETFQIRLFNPTNASFGGPTQIFTTGTILDDDPAGTVSMGQTQVNVLENDEDGMVNVPVTFVPNGKPARPVFVDFQTAEGTAVQSGPRDYFGNAGRLTFKAVEESQTINIPIRIIDDRIREGNEDFTVNITNVDGATLNEDAAVTTVIIFDNEPLPFVRITPNNARYLEGSGNQNLNVSLLNPSQSDVTINYTFVNGNGNPNQVDALNAATRDQDYEGIDGTLTFTANGPTSLPIPFIINDDGIFEPEELFTVRLTRAAPNVNFENNMDSVTVAIVEDDPSPNLTISSAIVAEGNDADANAGNVLTFNATLDRPSKTPVSFTYSTLNLRQDTCTIISGCEVASDEDYTSVRNVPVVIAPGEVTAPITVRVTGDTRNELNEQFSVVARSLVGAKPSVDRSQPARIIFGTVAFGTITNDDAGGVITIAAPGGNAVEGYQRSANNVVVGNAVQFPVTLPNVTGRAVTVNYELSGAANALDVEDLTTGSGPIINDGVFSGKGRLTFFPGDTTRVISFRANPDNLVEGLESLRVTISLDDRNGANSFTAGGNSATAQTQIEDRTPRINAVSPTIGFPAYGTVAATRVSISGLNLRTDGNPRVAAVIFNGAREEDGAADDAVEVGLGRNGIVFASDNSINVGVPREAKSGPITLRLIDGTNIVSRLGLRRDQDGNLPNFVVQPVIDSFTPTTGVRGATTVTLRGTNFRDPNNRVTSVQFNGTNAPIVADNITDNNTIRVRVPQSATTGQLRVVTVNGGLGPLSQTALTIVGGVAGSLRFGPNLDLNPILEDSGNRSANATDFRDIAKNFDGVNNNTPHRPYQVFLVPARQSGGDGDGNIIRPSSPFSLRFRVSATTTGEGTVAPTISVRADLNNLGRFDTTVGSKQDVTENDGEGDGQEDGFVDIAIPAGYDTNNPIEVYITYAGKDSLPPVANGSSATVEVQVSIVNSEDGLYPDTPAGSRLFAAVERREAIDNTNVVAVAFNANSTNSFSIPFSTNGSGSVAQTDVFNMAPNNGVNYRVYRFNAAGQRNNRTNGADFLPLADGDRLQRGVGYRLVVGNRQVQLRTQGSGLQTINGNSFAFNLTRNVPLAATASNAVNATNGYNFIGFPFNNRQFSGVNFNDATVTFNGETRSLSSAASAGLVNRQLFRVDAQGNLVAVTGDPIIRPFEAYFVQIFRDNITLTLNNPTGS